MRRDWLIRVVALLTLANGLIGVLHTLFARVPDPSQFARVLPYGVHHWSKLLTLVTGFMLVDLASRLWFRRRVAWAIAIVVLVVAALAHVGREHHPALALAPIATAALLFALRHRFTVRSEPRSILRGLGLMAASTASALAYGIVGFWLLDRRDFGIEFHWQDAVRCTLRTFALIGNPDLIPHTRHARWFLDSLSFLGASVGIFALFSLYRPIAFRLRTLPHERTTAERILAAHGSSALDYFKLWPDKSYFFGADGRAFVAYRAAWGVAIGLGDPVGPDDALEPVLRDFIASCGDNGWRVAFHQTLPDHLGIYRAHGMHILKIGEEAIIDLQTFAAKTSQNGDFRRIRNRGLRLGLRVTRHEPPHAAAVMDEVQEISDEWLSLPGRRERSFTLGSFDRRYIQGTPLFVVREPGGRGLGFVNVIPCWPPGDSTIDLMRHRTQIPNGTMDVLFIELLLALAATHRRFSLGLAPLAGVGDRPGVSLEERAVHQMYEHLNRFFSYKGLRDYKAKFEPIWEDRFLVYTGGPTGLVSAGIALSRITEGR
jgi:phosphatidylglycerol lysyltransferase